MESRKMVVVIGAGFAGLRIAKRLANVPVQVMLLDRQNYHLFQPLLYQVATAGLEPEEIAVPFALSLGARLTWSTAWRTCGASTSSGESCWRMAWLSNTTTW